MSTALATVYKKAEQLLEAGELNPSHIITEEMWGHPTDFLIERESDGDAVKIKIKVVMPEIRFLDGQLVAFAPPRYPWPTQEVPRA